jgi:hypothetical protein
LRYFKTDKRLAPSFWSDGLLWFAFLTITIVALYAIRQWAISDVLPLINPPTIRPELPK